MKRTPPLTITTAIGLVRPSLRDSAAPYNRAEGDVSRTMRERAYR